MPENYRPSCVIPIHQTLIAAQSCDQAGFGPTFSCDDHLFTVMMLVEKSNELGKPCWVATLDFKKAFDTITNESIWRALDGQGVRRAYILVLRKFYADQRAAVQTNSLSRTVGIFRGTKQGDPISLILFNAAVEDFMRGLKEELGHQAIRSSVGLAGGVGSHKRSSCR